MTRHDPGTGLVGTSAPRREDERLLAGRGTFVADLAHDADHVVFVRSPLPHALIVSIDTAEAARMPGVVAVVTAGDLPLRRPYVSPLTKPDPVFAAATAFRMAEQRLALMAADRVHYVGQAVAAVVATDRYLAEDAAELVDVTYTPLPAVVDAEDALAPGAPVLHEHLDGNEAASIAIAFGDREAARAAAAVTVSETYRVGRHGAVPLECRGVVVRHDHTGGGLDVWTSTQIPHMVRQGICEATGWAQADVRVHVPDVGGGFGTKANVYAEEVLVAVMAAMTGGDVAWVEDRQEHLTAAAQGRDQVHHCRLSVDADGRILLLEDEFVVNSGAGSLWVAGIVANSALHILGPYRIDAVDIRGRAAFTNKAIVAQYRGAGRPEASFALERSLDAAARELGISPVEIRRRNLLDRVDLPYARPVPYRDGVPIVYDGADYTACLDAVLDLLPESSVDGLRAEHPDLRVGHGVGCYIEATGRGPYECAQLAVGPDGTVEVLTGAASAGQGHETTFGQVLADALGVGMEHVRVRRTDTRSIPHGIGSFGSRSAVLAGNAVAAAAAQLVEAARCRVAEAAGAEAEYAGGRFHVPGHTPMTWADVAALAAPGGPLEGRAPLTASSTYRCRTVTWTMGAHAAVVGVHRATGKVSVLRYAVAHEGGVEINPQIVEGQVLGGVAQGLGGTLLEEFRFGADGVPHSTTFADYLLPSAGDVPGIAVRHLGAPTDNPLGVRGAGESGVIAVYAAVSGAVDAAVGSGHVQQTPVSASGLRAALTEVAA